MPSKKPQPVAETEKAPTSPDADKSVKDLKAAPPRKKSTSTGGGTATGSNAYTAQNG